jgi:Ca2+-binding RTX toxin-like protein
LSHFPHYPPPFATKITIAIINGMVNADVIAPDDIPNGFHGRRPVGPGRSDLRRRRQRPHRWLRQQRQHQGDTLNGGLGLADGAGYSYSLVGGSINLATGLSDFGVGDQDNLIGIEAVQGSQGRDVITGSNAANTLDGGRSSDSILGGIGDDTLLGGLGADTLDGGANNDLLIGGNGPDILTGGSGVDQFKYFSPTQGPDLITDFTAASEQIQVVSGGFGALPLGTLAAANFRLAAEPLPASAVFVYDGATGILSFDSDGSGVGGAVSFAQLAGLPAFAATNIQIVAS